MGFPAIYIRRLFQTSCTSLTPIKQGNKCH